MHRHAFIITATSASASPIASEASLWSAFLCSPCGGAWKADEISALEGASREEVLAAVAGAQGADYSLVVYLGCGQLVKSDVPWAEWSLRLAGEETVSERELNTGTARIASFFNCSHGDDSPTSTNAESLKFPEGKIGAGEAREAYDVAVNAAEMGRGTITAESGGVAATVDLISAAVIWCASNGGILTLPKAVELANGGVDKLKYRGGRRMRHFPLAVGVA